MKRQFIIFVFLCSGMSCFSQTKIVDSLKLLIRTSNNNEKKLAAIFELNEQTLHADTLLPFVVIAENLAGTSGDKHAVAKAAYCRAGYYARKNLIDSGIAIIDKLIESYEGQQGNQKLYLKFLFFQAKLLDRANQYSKSLAQLYRVVETAEELRDTLILIQARTGIGWVLIEMEQYKEALKWLYAARNTTANEHYYKNYGALYSNLAAAFNGIGRRDSAIYYINYAVNNARKNENLLFLATALSMQAKIFVDNGLSHLAEAPLQEVLQIRKKLNDPFYVVFDMSNLASYYAKNNQPQKGIALCLEGIALAKNLGLPSQLLMVYKALAENYKVAGNQQAYAKTLEDIISLKDSFNNINSAKMLAEMQAANETRKREKIISDQKLTLTIKNYLLFGSAVFALLIGIIIWLAFKNYKRKQKLNMALAIEKEKMLAAQAVKDAEEAERKRIAADLHDNLGAQANAILYSTELLQQESNTRVLVADLHHTAKDMLTSLRETLWVLKNQDITASDIWIRIINFSKQINRHYPQVKIVTEGLAPQLKLNSTRALNIVFIIQEAINNAVRHASATSIRVNSEFSADHWRVTISDDGKGFDLAAMDHKQESYGLHNMKERAATVALDLSINTERDRGTNIELLIKEINP
jgi:two-component system, NarL family, sensor kinase